MAADLSRARIAILGCGAVGSAFAGELVDRTRKYRRIPFRGEFVLWSRSRASVRRCRSLLVQISPRWGARVEAPSSLEEAVRGADVVLVCVSDAALAEVTLAAGRAVAARRLKPVFLLSSGYQRLEPLRARLGRGIAVGRLHPLTPVLPWSAAYAVTLQCEPFGIEGDPRAQRAARSLLRHWDGTAIRLEPGQSAAYHAGASLLGGGIVALFALAEELMAPAVRSRRALRAALQWFASENVENAGRLAPRHALTGPLARGAEATVRGHLRALGRVPHARASYLALGEVMLDLARARGSLDAAAERRLQKLLRGRERAR